MKKRVLLIEDNPSILKMTKCRLEHEGYDVVTAHDGAVALEQAETHLPIHLILLDVKLPKLNGYRVCQRLKARGATAHIPVIVFTGSEHQIQRLADRCIEAGAADWIKKPFRSQELMEKIARAIREAEMKREEGERHG